MIQYRMFFIADKASKWMNMEPEMMLLLSVKYTDPEGNDKKIASYQKSSSCRCLGTQLGITTVLRLAIINIHITLCTIIYETRMFWIT